MFSRARLLSVLGVGIVLLLTTPKALAVSEQIFSFERGNVNQKWSGYGDISVEQADGGVIVTARGTGSMLSDTKLTIDADVALFNMTSDQPLSVFFSWHSDKTGSSSYYAPLKVRAGKDTTAVIALKRYPRWRGQVDQIGLQFKPGAKVKIHHIVFAQFNPFEKFIEYAKSFWTFDTYSPYSINFLWGPRLALTSYERAEIYQIIPPSAPSAVRVLYGCIIVVLVVAAALILWRLPRYRRKRAFILVAVGIVGSMWLLLDLRSGAEFLSWVIHDQETYIERDSGDRSFRERDGFYDFAEQVAPLVSDRTSYVFLGDRIWPYLGNMRYITYPAIPGNAYDKDDTWVIWNRPDISVNEAGQLVSESEAFTTPGKVLLKFDDSSLVFRMNLP